MPYAIDLFCGVGGFSEGILQAGFDIIFSSDSSEMMEETYVNRHEQLGIIQGIDTFFELADIQNLSSEFIFEKINSLKYGNIFTRGEIDVIFGGPSCQGYRRLGKKKDPRNILFHEYLRIIKDIYPKYVVMENVTGIKDMNMLNFPSVLQENKCYKGQNNIPFILQSELTGLGYTVLDFKVLDTTNYGVPQQRNRAVFLAYRKDVLPICYPEETEQRVNVYAALGNLYKKTYTTSYSQRCLLGRTKNIHTNIPASRILITNMEEANHEKSVIQRFSLYNTGDDTKKALSRCRKEGIDLKKKAPNLFWDSLFQLNYEYNTSIVINHIKQFDELKNLEITPARMKQINKILYYLWVYKGKRYPDKYNTYLKILSEKIGSNLEITQALWDSIKDKLNQHLTALNFNKLLKSGTIDDEMALVLFTKRNITKRLKPSLTAPTMLTMLPDDFIHPYFNRVLTVREMARLQSFDDSFQFLGKRTTGGDKEALKTSQFTQVGNAVPPLLAKAFALEIINVLHPKKGNPK